MDRTYDIAIIGAGPAGSMCARELARRCPHLKILIIDGQDPDRTKPCGGLLAPDAQKLLARLDLTLPKEILADPQIFAVETIDLPHRLIRYYQRHYLNMNRYAFDKWLFSLIPDTVCKISARCISVEREKSIFTLTLLCNGAKKSVCAKNIIGADGSASTVRRIFFRNDIHRYIAIQQHFVNNGQQLPYYSCIFDPDTSESCSWTIHKDGYVIFGGAFSKNECRRAFEKQKERFEKLMGASFGTPVKTEACLLSSPRRMRDFVTGNDRVYLVGEAAGFISPSSFEGISSAIKSGILLAGAFEMGQNEHEVAAIYKRKTLTLKLKMYFKNAKKAVICTPFSRLLVMKTGIQSVEKY